MCRFNGVSFTAEKYPAGIVLDGMVSTPDLLPHHGLVGGQRRGPPEDHETSDLEAPYRIVGQRGEARQQSKRYSRVISGNLR